ncbi:MAG: STY4526/YPO1902 family pathogenicity island replication protein [Gammaproteobacteria bacterium]|nr:STY4526/YPO1902 family pathogenicity island replication protein [Gammaproteobacteria bacterium]
MMKTKEAELTSAVLLYAIRCVAEGDYAALRQMQMGDREIDEMKRIGIRDLYNAGSLRSHCVSIQLNRDVFWSMIRYMRAQTETDDSLQELIDQDAPFELVRNFYGLSTREYTRRRKSGTGLTNAGRPQEPTDEEVDRLWDVWETIEGRDANGRLSTPARYLQLSEELNIPLRSIWLLTERWIRTDAELARVRQRTG